MSAGMCAARERHHAGAGAGMVTGFGSLVATALIVPALLIFAVPRRWLGRAMLMWALLPLIAYVGVIAWEGETRP